MSRWFWMVVLVVLIGSPADARAQISADGSVRGQVRDEQQAALPGVSVTAIGTDVAGSHSVVTDSSGVYRLLNLPPGTYTVAAEQPCVCLHAAELERRQHSDRHERRQ